VLCLAALFVLVVYPLGWLVARSFATPDWHFTLDNLREALRTPRLRVGVINTLTVSSLVSVVSAAAGLGLALLSVRTRLAGRGLLRLLALAPFLCPPIIASIAWTLLADPQGGLLNVFLERLGCPWRFNIYSRTGLVFVSALLTTPLSFLLLEGSVRQVSAELEEQARLCGAGGWQSFRRVTLPLLLPAVTSAALLSFLQSNIHFGIHAPIGMPANIWMITTLIYTSTMVGPVDLGAAAALSFLLVAMGLALLAAQLWLLRGRRFTLLTGKSRPPRPVEIGFWRYPAAAAVAVYLALAVVLPYGVLFLRSLVPYQRAGHWLNGAGAEAYRALWETPVLVRAMTNSLLLGFAAAAACLVLALAVGYVVFRTRLPGRGLVHSLVLAAPALSGVAIGVAFIFAFGTGPVPLYGTLWILLLAYVARELSTAFKALEGPSLQIDPHMEESAWLCGASWAATGRRVLLPLLRPALASGAALVFIAAFREIGASSMLFSHGSEVLGSQMMVIWHDGRYRELSALAVVSAAVCLAVAGLMLWAGGKRDAWRTR
jgi:iron(III) transport system permease protein